MTLLSKPNLGSGATVRPPNSPQNMAQSGIFMIFIYNIDRVCRRRVYSCPRSERPSPLLQAAKKKACMKSTRDRILQTLLRQPRRTINELAEAVGINPISVRHHLTNMQVEGLGGRGRRTPWRRSSAPGLCPHRRWHGKIPDALPAAHHAAAGANEGIHASRRRKPAISARLRKTWRASIPTRCRASAWKNAWTL